MIVVKNINAVEIDGTVAGDVVSCLANHPNRKLELLKALQDFVDTLVADFQKRETILLTTIAEIQATKS